jgi:hypothetical protein
MNKPTHSEHTRTISQLEEHTAQLRARVDDTLAQLGHQLTPARLGRAAAAKAGVKLLSGSGRLARSIKRHPQAALAVGIGVIGAWCLRRWMRR